MKAFAVSPWLLFASIFTCLCGCVTKEVDNSLAISEYEALGVPGIQEPWDMNDYSQAHNVLAKMKWERPLQLPMKESKRSGPLFAKMTGFEYLSFLNDANMPLSAKAQKIANFSRVYTFWMDIYSNPTIQPAYYSREVIDIQLFNLKLTEEMLHLAHQINASEEPGDIALQYGYNGIKRNYLSCLSADLKTQSFTSQFRVDDLNRMADSVYQSVIRNKEWMDLTEMKELKQALRLVIDSTSSEYIRRKYRDLETLLPA